MSHILTLNDISVNNKNQQRLINIDLKINRGEKIALVGKSGAGKSTLIEVANGSLKPTKGQVLFNGQNIRQLSAKQRCKIGTLWQETRLIEELNVVQNVNVGALGRKSLIWALINLFSMPEVNTCIQCLKIVGLSKNTINTNVGSLSGGQRRRVSIAMLIRQQPEIILADEPFSNLDPKLSTEIREILLSKKVINSIKISDTLLVSIHQIEHLKFFNRIIGLKHGRIFFDKKPSAIKVSELDDLYDECQE